MIPMMRNEGFGNETEVAVIGGGIVGLAQALAAAKRGRSVTIFDRTARPEGASVRNFGTIWPIGFPSGPLRDAALVGRQMWLDLAKEAGFWINPCGSIHLARADDEQAVIEEFMQTSVAKAQACQILTPQQIKVRSPGVRMEGLRCGLWSPTELGLDSREAIVALTNYLRETYAVRIEYNTTVVGVESQSLTTAEGQRWRFEDAFVCGGPDFLTLFPEVFAQSGVRKCKLQMMRTVPQPNNWRMGPHIAGGLTLRHYANFQSCPSVGKVRDRFAAENPDLDKYAIHVMAAQNGLGEVIIGDSHEYDSDIEPFDKPEIDELILEHIGRLIELPDPRILRRWHGFYPRHRTVAQYTNQPMDHVRIVLNSNGLGMTVSFGLAEIIHSEMAGQPREEVRI